MGHHGHPPMPRVFLVRHGETEWSLNGRHTGTTDIPLTPKGEQMIKTLAPNIVGDGKLLDSKNIQHAFVSPRTRAQRTFQLLFEGSQLPKFSTEEDVREWTYGDYEGRTASDIRASRPTWDIWVDGCEGGESAEEMSARCDSVIERIVDITKSHKESSDCEGPGDVLIVSHGHFTRCFLTRWCELPLNRGRIFVADTGAISVCGYQHGSFKERSLLGMNLFGEI